MFVLWLQEALLKYFYGYGFKIYSEEGLCFLVEVEIAKRRVWKNSTTY